ncbi:MAG TPA: hypothetical protein VJG90_01765 [Candidatus Nanoarchaeia archaeon]|nr:hypothetical protein [Candidatus Nanoarchaeia archaeon]
MTEGITDQVLAFEANELGLLSHFFQNAATLCWEVTKEMRDKKIQDYVLLLESLSNSLRHAWPLAESLARKEQVNLVDIRRCVETMNTLVGVIRTHKELGKVEKQGLMDAVGGIQTDVSDFAGNQERLHRLVAGIKEQLKRVVGLLSDNVKMESKALGVLKEMVDRFDRDFVRIQEESGRAKEGLVIHLKRFLMDKQDELMQLLGNRQELEFGFN